MRPLLPLLVLLAALTAGEPSRSQGLGQGPWNNALLISESTDGVRFVNPRVWLQGGGVPNLVNDGKGRLIATFQWFPQGRSDAWDKIAVRFSTDRGKSWTNPEPITVEGLPPGHNRPCDPTLAVLDDGRFRLYFTSDPGDRKGAGTYSAISKDAIHYTFEPGARFRAENRLALDCSVQRLGNTWHYFSPVQKDRGRAYHAVSVDGLSFTRTQDLSLETRDWLGCAVQVGSKLRFYGTSWSATSSDGLRWILDPASRFQGADPGVASTGDGRYVMISTGPSMASPTPQSSVSELVATPQYVYVRRGDELLQFDGRTLQLVSRTSLAGN